MRINTYDIDGVLYMGEDRDGIYPGPRDIIITGRSFEEAKYTNEMLTSRGITNTVFFNPLKFDEKTRESSGLHKATVINCLMEYGFDVAQHYEDDPIQANIIRKVTGIPVILLQHDLVEKENVWHGR